MALTHAQLHILVLHAWRAKPGNIPKKVIVFCRNIGTLLVIPGVAPITTNTIQVMVVRTTCRTGNTTVTASLNICIALLTYNILLWSGCGILCAPLSGDEVHSPFLWTFSLFSYSFCFFLGSFSSSSLLLFPPFSSAFFPRQFVSCPPCLARTGSFVD